MEYLCYSDWYDSLNDLQKIQIKVLDAYFSSRYNLPGTSIIGEVYIEDHKTTIEIIEELQDMINLSCDVVHCYLYYKEFDYITIDDGTIKWAIWRDINPLHVTKY